MSSDPPATETNSRNKLAAAFLAHQIEALQHQVDGIAVSSGRGRGGRPGSKGSGRGSQGGRGASPGVLGALQARDVEAARAGGGSTLPDRPHTNLANPSSSFPSPPSSLIILDASALIHSLPTIRRWLHAQNREIIVPSEVLHSLDLLKKGTSRLAHHVRQATRFLETNLSSPSNSPIKAFMGLRASLPEETAALPEVVVSAGEQDGPASLAKPKQPTLDRWTLSILSLLSHHPTATLILSSPLPSLIPSTHLASLSPQTSAGITFAPPASSSPSKRRPAAPDDDANYTPSERDLERGDGSLIMGLAEQYGFRTFWIEPVTEKEREGRNGGVGYEGGKAVGGGGGKGRKVGGGEKAVERPAPTLLLNPKRLQQQQPPAPCPNPSHVNTPQSTSSPLKLLSRPDPVSTKASQSLPPKPRPPPPASFDSIPKKLSPSPSSKPAPVVLMRRPPTDPLPSSLLPQQSFQPRQRESAMRTDQRQLPPSPKQGKSRTGSLRKTAGAVVPPVPVMRLMKRGEE